MNWPPRPVMRTALRAGLLLFCVGGCTSAGGERNAATSEHARPISARAARVEWRRIGDAGAGADSFELATSWRPVDPSHVARGGWSSSVWLASLPDGEAKRRYILDCTGCHQLNETRVFRGDSLRTAAMWAADAQRMLDRFGATKGFPIISDDAHPDLLATFLSSNLTGEPPIGAGRTYEAIVAPPGPGLEGGSIAARITEYELPVAPDLPHDVAIARDGTVLVTGMFTHQIYTIDPDSGVTGAVPIPVENANPRAIEVDAAGDWWVLCGAPQAVARYQPTSGEWSSWAIGMYPHSIAPSADGRRVWFNGHFTRDPELIGWLDPGSGEVTSVTTPPHPSLGTRPGGPIPYEARLAPNGYLWISELQGNRLLGYNPGNGAWRTATLPMTWGGPRRFDIARDGVIWIPAYAASQLIRFDPGADSMEAIDLPIADSVPYVVRVHPSTGQVWIGTAAADVLYRYDPPTRRFDIIPVPTRGTSMRHMTIDPASGAVWIAYGASPAIHPPRVARIEVVRAG